MFDTSSIVFLAQLLVIDNIELIDKNLLFCEVKYKKRRFVCQGNKDSDQRRYSPADCKGIEKLPISGKPDKKEVSTSYVERQNLTMRMSMRRFTRLTNGFSKKIENLVAAVSLYFMHYNFCRVHQTLRVTPAMEAGITDHVWSLEEIINLLN